MVKKKVHRDDEIRSQDFPASYNTSGLAFKIVIVG